MTKPVQCHGLARLPTLSPKVSHHPIKCQKDIKPSEGDTRIADTDKDDLIFMADPEFLAIPVFILQQNVVGHILPETTAMLADDNGGSRMGWGFGKPSDPAHDTGEQGSTGDQH